MGDHIFLGRCKTRSLSVQPPLGRPHGFEVRRSPHQPPPLLWFLTTPSQLNKRADLEHYPLKVSSIYFCHRTLNDELPRLVGSQYATGDQWRNNSRKNEEMEPKQKQHPVVDVTGDGSKIWCCKEQYCIWTWNVRFMNQGKLEVVKQEMARVNINILGISELKWIRMGEFNSDDHYIYYCGQESLRRNGIATIVNKSPKCSTWMHS